jgi:hypothetical protein
MMKHFMLHISSQVPSPPAFLAIASGGASLPSNSVDSLQVSTPGVYLHQSSLSAPQLIPIGAHPEMSSSFNIGRHVTYYNTEVLSIDDSIDGGAQGQVLEINMQAVDKF